MKDPEDAGKYQVDNNGTVPVQIIGDHPTVHQHFYAMQDKATSSPYKSPIIVKSKIRDVDYIVTVDQWGRRIIVPASGHTVLLIVRAADSRTTIIESLCPIVHSRSEATGSLSLHLGVVPPRHFNVCLDEPPYLKPRDPAGPDFPFTVGPTDPELFELTVNTSTGDVQWSLELNWMCLEQEGTLRVDLGGYPFRTMARPKRKSVS